MTYLTGMKEDSTVDTYLKTKDDVNPYRTNVENRVSS